MITQLKEKIKTIITEHVLLIDIYVSELVNIFQIFSSNLISQTYFNNQSVSCIEWFD